MAVEYSTPKSQSSKVSHVADIVIVVEAKGIEGGPVGLRLACIGMRYWIGRETGSIINTAQCNILARHIIISKPAQRRLKR
jgi:hypothetical protein